MTPNHEQQMEARAWLEAHDLSGEMTPVESKLRRDPETGEWLLEVFDLRDGKRYLNTDGEAAKKTISFPDRGIEPPAWFVATEPA